MKFKLILPDTNPKPIQYPVLANSLNRGQGKELVVLFLNANSGVVMVDNIHCYSIGKMVSNFVSVEDQTLWDILPEGTKIEITV